MSPRKVLKIAALRLNVGVFQGQYVIYLLSRAKLTVKMKSHLYL